MCFEDAVVSMIGIDGDTALCSIVFEETLGDQGRVGIEMRLMIDFDEFGSSIIENGTTTILII